MNINCMPLRLHPVHGPKKKGSGVSQNDSTLSSDSLLHWCFAERFPHSLGRNGESRRVTPVEKALHFPHIFHIFLPRKKWWWWQRRCRPRCMGTFSFVVFAVAFAVAVTGRWWPPRSTLPLPPPRSQFFPYFVHPFSPFFLPIFPMLCNFCSTSKHIE